MSDVTWELITCNPECDISNWFIAIIGGVAGFVISYYFYRRQQSIDKTQEEISREIEYSENKDEIKSSEHPTNFKEKSEIVMKELENPNWKWRSDKWLKLNSDMDDDEFSRFLKEKRGIVRESRLKDRFGNRLFRLI